MTQPTIPIVQVDAFTSTPFAGNPAAVCFLFAPREPGWMQAIAREMNLSETAFLLPRSDGYQLRWFTPSTEVDLCGHATLASAHALWEAGHLAPDQPAHFHTRSGLLRAERAADWITLDFPALPYAPAEQVADLHAILGTLPVAVQVGKQGYDYLIELESEAAVRSLQPDLARLEALGMRGMIVTSRASDANYDIVSRYFAPGWGIPEDPVTGSAHCALAPYWQARLGKTELTAYQASARGGVLRVALRGERVQLSGQAVTVLRGTLV
jgi:PhzF family phenazine biosynthesis protein